MVSDGDVFIRIMVTVLLCGAIGYERQFRHKTAGLRTHILVGLGACVLTIVSIDIGRCTALDGAFQIGDPGRIAAQIVTGIGFLGGGAIMANRYSGSVKGLTTAATIWVVSAIGMACGAGLLLLSLISTVILLIVVVALGLWEIRIFRSLRGETHCFLLRLRPEPQFFTGVVHCLTEAGLELEYLQRRKDDGPDMRSIFIMAKGVLEDKGELYAKLIQVEGVEDVQQSSENSLY